MTTKVTVRLNEELQIVEQRVEGPLTQDAFAEMMEKTLECAARLADPGNVRVLADSRSLGKPAVNVRQTAIGMLRDEKLKRLAVWGADALRRISFRFFAVMSPFKNKIRGFKERKDALAWLLEEEGQAA
ncbi:MAG: hypothetical protein GF418_02025 [Chitinivibrionales bacterium]|nr:hypothetical protein [Chitinivibrionales bacterium]MBD3394378.1 hypothetical protein [Chitinivibrionales bacterium]